MRRKERTSRHHGFTLVELLVVVAILALLTAMLWPAVTRSKDLAHFAACKARLHRVGQGVMQYANDNRGRLVQTPTLENPLIAVVHAYHVRKPYVADPNEFYCPSLAPPAIVYSPENLQAGNIGYFYYSAAKVAPNPYLSTFLRHIVSWPRDLTVWQDPASWVFSDMWYSGQPTSHWMYKKGVNYLTLNGQVSSATESPREDFR